MSGKGSFKIGHCLIEQDLDRISRGSETVTVRPQVMDVLVYLASRGGQIVHADELLDDLWPGKVVTSASVYNCVTELRHAFLTCDNGQPYVDTIPKRGYRLVAPVTGFKESKAATSQNTASPFSGRMAFIVISLLVATVLLFAWHTWWPVAPMDKSIAVMAFENMSDDPEQEYFSDGISEELLNVLAQIPELRVISRSSAFSLKGKSIAAPMVAKQLNVAYVLEGSVRRVGNRVRVTAQLIEASSDTHLWSESYDRELADIFALQDEIVAAVVDALKIRLLGDKPKTAEINLEAFTLHQQGRHLYYQLTAESITQAEALLKQALAIDPGYAPAWSDLAKVLYTQVLFGDRPADEGHELARDAVQRALEFDRNYGQAYANLAWIEMFYDRDFAGADQHVQQALALSPNDAQCLAYAGHLNLMLGHLDEAIDWYQQAIVVDPVWHGRHETIGMALFYAHRLEEAERSMRVALSSSPDNDQYLYYLAMVLLARGDAAAALATIQQVKGNGWRLKATAIVQHALGDADLSDAALKELIESHATDWGDSVAEVYAFRGEIDDAFDWLERTSDSHNMWMALTVLPNPLLVNLHGDPRWEAFLDKMGLPH
jgi:TolB-like protein/DNA-binding winged helix-turn-helix (wHTH) protein/Tfp pilus assembly protein PilF